MNMKCCLALACLLLGCSNGQLDRKTAVKAIDARFSDDVTGIFVETGRVGPHCGYQENDGRVTPLDLTPEKDVDVMVAIEAGYLAAKPDGPDYWQVTLTDKGKAAPNMEGLEGLKRLRSQNHHNTLNGCDFQPFTFAVASRQVVKITGISSNKDTSMVEFDWKWSPTELGRALRVDGEIYRKLTPQQRNLLLPHNPIDIVVVHLPVPPEDEIRHGTLPFKKYDDGWRLQAPPKMNERY